MRFLFRCILTCCVAALCQASELYTFTYDAASGPVQSFSFSFTSPGFVTDGSSPAFAPFTPTDGANSWTMTQDLAVSADPFGCFMFGTASAGLGGFPPFTGPCSVSVGGPGDSQAALLIALNGGLPTAAGVYTPHSFSGLFDTESGFETINGFEDYPDNTGTMTLTITGTGTPEPASLGLIAIGLAALIGLSVKKRLAGRG
jgi:hypothetical protein